MIAYYGSKISEHMTKTPEGFLICHDVPIARTGQQEYLAGELGLDGDPDRPVQVQRCPEDVFDPAAVASFEGKDVTQNHPPESLTPENHALYAKGHAENVHREGDYLVADLHLKDPGLMNNPNVTETTAAATGTGSSTQWKDKSPQQILKDVNDLLSAVWAACEYDTDAIPNHILLPYEQYNYILTTMVSDLASETIYDFLMKNNAAVKNGGELFIGGCRWCKGAGTGQGDRMVGYVNKPRYIKMDELVPMSRIMTAPNVTNVCYDTAYMANISEVQLFYPTSILYVDGI